MARLNIKVVPNARQNKVVEEPGRLKVYLTAPAVEGKANEALIKYLSEHFHVKKNKISIISGLTSRLKIIEIT